MVYENRQSKYRLIKRLGALFLMILLLWLSFGAGVYLSGQGRVLERLAEQEVVYVGELLGKYEEAPEGKLSQDIDFNLFWEVWDTLKQNYVDQEDLNDKQMFYGALRGMVSSLGDPYTVFMDPKIAKDFQDDLAGTFEGIGAEIGIKNDVVTIIAPLPDMPAESAGLQAGDKILAIDEVITSGMSIDEAVRRIRGERGTEVVLTISRKGEDEVRDIPITRDKIVVKSVRTEVREDGLYLIEISNFNDDTESLFNDAVREVISLDPEGIILDLRNNPGGYLDTAIEVASEWVESDVVVTEKYNDDRKFEHLSRGRARLAGYPTVVLVNRGSASASEIVAGALQDNGLATVVGEQTFGKGSVQTLSNLSDGSSVKVTIAKWLTPGGRSINDEGIAPDMEVELTLEEYNSDIDPQMERAADVLLGRDTGWTATSTVEAATGTPE